MNLILITSVVKIPNKKLSYTNIRSVFTSNDRFEQTKKTIESVKNKIPNSKIFIIECSNLTEEHEKYFKNNSDYFLNLYGNDNIENTIYGESKSLAEGTMTIKAIEYIFHNNIHFDNFYKISGRYWLSDKFDYNIFNNNHNIFKKINNDVNNINTTFFKLTSENIDILYNFLKQHINDMKKCIGYEILFGKFIKIINAVKFIEIIGIEGYVSVCGSHFKG